MNACSGIIVFVCLVGQITSCGTKGSMTIASKISMALRDEICLHRFSAPEGQHVASGSTYRSSAIAPRGFRLAASNIWKSLSLLRDLNLRVGQVSFLHD